MMTIHKFLFSILLAASSVLAHTRLECPPPRSGETGEKVGPCDAPDDPSLPAYPLVPGALNTITWLESISHPGAPARFALSLDGDDSMESFESCLLLDHVPHDELSLPSFMDQLTWHRSSITLWIPDVYCERCHLQLMTVMSDEVHGVPENTTCAYGGALATNRIGNSSLPACPVVYHSCAPVSINGTIPRNDMAECNTTEFEEQLDWPMTPRHNADLYNYSTYYYKGDPGMYNQTMSRLLAAGAPIEGCDNLAFCDPQVYFESIMTVPQNAAYVAMEGTCAAMVTMQVEEFELGNLPSDPKNMSAVGALPTAQEMACAQCNNVKPCFYEACALRDMETGNWTGQAEGCSMFGQHCEFCFPDSTCLMDPPAASQAEDEAAAGDDDNGTEDPESVPEPPLVDVMSGAGRMRCGHSLVGVLGVLNLFW